MSDDISNIRRRESEERYFQKIEQELIAKIRQRAEEAARLRSLSEKTGIVDEGILSELRALGYTEDTLKLLYLAPLVQVAWADGQLSDRERDLILEAARSRGIDADSSAGTQLKEWLANRPSDEMFAKTMHVIGALLEARPAAERETTERDLLSYASAIADASGGILGFGKVSAEERELIARITNELTKSHAAAAEKTLADLEKKEGSSRSG
jgi:tellurite resistance protein